MSSKNFLLLNKYIFLSTANIYKSPSGRKFQILKSVSFSPETKTGMSLLLIFLTLSVIVTAKHLSASSPVLFNFLPLSLKSLLNPFNSFCVEIISNILNFSK